MNVNSNSYTYAFAIGLVVVVAAALAIAATGLKPAQDANIELEKKANILSSIGLQGEDPASQYGEVIKEQLVLKNGQVVAGKQPGTIDLAAAIALPEADREVPLYVAEHNGQTYYIALNAGAVQDISGNVLADLQATSFTTIVPQTVFQRPWVVLVVIVNVLVILNIPREIRLGREFSAFLSSCAGMVLMMATFGLTYFPYMVRSNPNPENSLTVLNAASTDKTLGIMLVIALIGVPIVLAYTASIYYIFRGKVKLTSHSY